MAFNQTRGLTKHCALQVGFAVRMEERYRGVRFPHKTKAAVSGCTRECAEAQGKDFGAIAVDGGYNIFVCGNGGAKPRHADLLGGPWDEATSLRMLDRFLMYGPLLYRTAATTLSPPFSAVAEPNTQRKKRARNSRLNRLRAACATGIIA